MTTRTARSTAHGAVVRAALAAVAGVLLLVAGLVGAPAAQAHTELVSSTPANGASLDTAPATVVLTFDEVPKSVESVRAEATGGGLVELGKPTLKGTVVTVAWPADAPPGLYRLGWTLVSDDGDPVEGTILFSYAAAAAPASTAPSAAPSAQQPVATTTEAHPSTAVALAGIGVAALVVVAAALTAVAAVRRSRRRRSPQPDQAYDDHQVAETTVGR